MSIVSSTAEQTILDLFTARRAEIRDVLYRQARTKMDIASVGGREAELDHLHDELARLGVLPPRETDDEDEEAES